MKTYLYIHEIDTDDNELIIKVEPLYCADRDTSEIVTFVDNDYNPSKGDKLYFLPGVNIPRVKLKDLSLQHGIKTVRDMDQATHIFGSKNTKDKITTSTWYYKINTEAIKGLVEDPELVMDDYYKENLRQALEFYTEEFILIDYSDASILRNCELAFVTRHISGNMGRSSNIFYKIDSDHEDLFPDLLSKDVYDESKLLKHINGDDAATIDETMFLQISDMFKSSDQDNHILAMEIMANCNYIDSLLYIEMLFENYSGRMAECHTKNHVNFKSLLGFLGKNKSYMGTSIDQIVQSLINKDIFSLDKVEVIMKYYGETIANHGGTNFFEVKSLTLSEEAAKLLNTNYVHQTFPDYMPEGDVEIPEIHGDLIDLNSLEEINDVCSESAQEEEISDEDIETAITRIERNELKSELIALENELSVDQGTLEEESNNNQIEKDDDGFEWF